PAPKPSAVRCRLRPPTARAAWMKGTAANMAERRTRITQYQAPRWCGLGWNLRLGVDIPSWCHMCSGDNSRPSVVTAHRVLVRPWPSRGHRCRRMHRAAQLVPCELVSCEGNAGSLEQMRAGSLSRLAAGVAIAESTVIYGTDVFSAVVLRPAA